MLHFVWRRVPRPGPLVRNNCQGTRLAPKSFPRFRAFTHPLAVFGCTQVDIEVRQPNFRGGSAHTHKASCIEVCSCSFAALALERPIMRCSLEALLVAVSIALLPESLPDKAQFASSGRRNTLHCCFSAVTQLPLTDQAPKRFTSMP